MNLIITEFELSFYFSDCCDTSDEYLGKISCTNTCHELGRAERMELQKQAQISKMGYEAKIQSIKKGKQLKLDRKEKLKQLETDKQVSVILSGNEDIIIEKLCKNFYHMKMSLYYILHKNYNQLSSIISGS